MVRRVIGGTGAWCPRCRSWRWRIASEAYNLPQGVIAHLFRDIAAGKPGTLTHVGLDTFVDPRWGGGKVNARTTEDLVRLMEIDGKGIPVLQDLSHPGGHHPRHHRRPRRQPDHGSARPHPGGPGIAMAARNSGGVVIAQVERIAERGT